MFATPFLLLFPILAFCQKGQRLQDGGYAPLQRCGEDYDVLVLGAGIAGVKAAATLYEGGVRNFALLEQSNRLGGRMWNTEWQDHTIELGANWIEGIPQDEDPIWGIAQSIGLQGNYTAQEGSPIEPTLYDAGGRVRKEEAASLHERLGQALDGAMNISCEQHLRDGGDISLREALTRAGWPPMDQQTALERTLEFFVVDWDFQYSAEDISVFNYFDVGKEGSFQEACKKGGATHRMKTKHSHTAARMGMLKGFSWEAPRYFVTDSRGYAAVAEHVAKPFLESATAEQDVSLSSGQLRCPPKNRLLFNKTVVNIHYGQARDAGGNGVRVETSDGSVYWANRCIVTFSSGVVNAAVQSDTLFHPALPDWKATAFAKTQVGIYTKIFLRYSKRFWDDADYILYADPARRGYYAVWQDMESHGKFYPQKANILMVTLVQSDSKRVETQAREKTISEIQAALRQMYGPGIPEPMDIFVPKWHSNPFFRGCWSNIAIGTTPRDFDLMQQEVGGLYFAGEATDSDYNGFVLGGYHSGDRAAKTVLDDIARQAGSSSSRILSVSAVEEAPAAACPCSVSYSLLLGSLSMCKCNISSTFSTKALVMTFPVLGIGLSILGLLRLRIRFQQAQSLSAPLFMDTSQQ